MTMTPVFGMAWSALVITLIIAARIAWKIEDRKEHERGLRYAEGCDHAEAYRWGRIGWPCPGCVVDEKYGKGRFAKPNDSGTGA